MKANKAGKPSSQQKTESSNSNSNIKVTEKKSKLKQQQQPKEKKGEEEKGSNDSALDFLGDVGSPKLDTLEIITSEDGCRGWDSLDIHELYKYDLDKLRASRVPGYKMGDYVFIYTLLGNTSTNMARKAPTISSSSSSTTTRELNKVMFTKRVIPSDFKQSVVVNN